MITVLIPAYNEMGAIGATVKEIKTVLEKASNIDLYEILVVDDGSTDETPKEAEIEGARVFSNIHNLGYGRSLKNGIAEAKYDTICIIDADLTYPADQIPVLLDQYTKGYDMVVGNRTGANYSGILAKGPLRWLLRHLVQFAAGRKVPDANSGLRIFSKATVREYEPHLCDTFSFTTSMTLGYMRTAKYVKYIPIKYHERHGRTKVKLLKDSISTLQYIVQAILYYNPMKIFSLFALFCVLLSMLSFVAGAITGINAAYFLAIGGLLVSLVMFGFGLLADLLRQILIK